MASLNKIFMMGNLTRKPELRYTPKGSAVCEFGIAVNRQFTTSEGAQKEEVCFVDVRAWGRQAETCSRYLQKGSPAMVEGQLRMDSWQDKESGKKRTRHYIFADRVQFIGAPSGRGQNGGTVSGENPESDSSQQRRTVSQDTVFQQKQMTNEKPSQEYDVPPPKEAFEVDSEPDDDIPF